MAIPFLSNTSFLLVLLREAIRPDVLVNTSHVAQEKLRESLRAYIQAAPWVLLIQERFTNIGIVVVLRIPLIWDALPHLTLHMTIEYAPVSVLNLGIFCYYSHGVSAVTFLCYSVYVALTLKT